MQSLLKELELSALLDIQNTSSFENLEEIYKYYLGKEGKLNGILKSLKDLSVEEKKIVGPLANTLRIKIEEAHSVKKAVLEELEIEKQIENGWMDTSLPGKKHQMKQHGSLSPFAQFSRDSVEIFKNLGFQLWDGNHIVTDFENFESLNFPEDHPAREMQDTFYVEGGSVLRTHTSSMQNAILSTKDFPIRAIVPGKCFRHEATDARHEAIFLQLEGIVVGKGIAVSDLIGTLKHFLDAVFEGDVKTRIRPGYFPFVEPGLELEIDCRVCRGTGCKLCKGLGFIEVMPCGMIHPNVLKHAGIDSNEYSGFAFGFGISRLAQLKYGIADTRMMYSTDPRFMSQFRR